MQKGYNIQVKGFWISDFLFPLYLNQHFLDETKRTLKKSSKCLQRSMEKRGAQYKTDSTKDPFRK